MDIIHNNGCLLDIIHNNKKQEEEYKEQFRNMTVPRKKIMYCITYFTSFKSTNSIY